MMPPHQIDDIDTVFIDEDIPQYNLLDLSSYFHDPYSSIEHSIYSVDYISDESNITLIINGSFLDITHLAENWTGNVYVVVNCTNMYGLATSSNKFKITVSNVNDPPQVFLVSPKDGALLNRTDVTLSWQGIDVDAELTTFEYDLFFGKTENPELFISNLVVTNITITDLENGMTYYWYIVPDDRELEGICLNGTWNFTINLQQIPTEVILHSPLNGTTVNPNEVNLTWGVRNETEESPLFHIYIGSNEYNIAEIGTTENMWYVLGDLQKDSLYYWYVVPSVGTSYGICSSGIWHFNVDLSFIAVYDITVESDVDRLEISHGNGTVFNITLTNIGNALTTVSLTPYGPISGFVNMSRNLTLPIQTSKTIPVVIDNIALFPEGTYEFTIEILHPGGTETFLIPVNITSWKPAGGADDTDDDIPDSRGTSKELWEDNQLLFVLGIIAAFVTASIVILLVIKRKKRKQPPHEDHYPTDGEAVSARVDVPPAVDVSPPQYYSNIQYPQSDDRTYESPPVQPNEPVHPTDESSFPSETIPDIQPKYPSDYYGPEHQEPVPEPVPSSSVGEAQSMLFTTYEAVKCSICLGYIKNGAQAFKCACSKIFHPTCGARTGMCPICQRTITSEDVGLSEPETPTTKVIPKIIPVDEPLNVNWRSDPRILGASEDFNISDIFLIGLDGLLIRSMSFSTSVREGTDQDIMTGMLTAVTDFIRDSFRDEMGGLKTLQYGRMTIYLERGVTFYLVTVFRGEPPEDLRRRMRGGLIQLWERYKHYLKAWDGTAEGLEGIDNCLMESLGLQPPLADEPDNEGDDYQPPKFTGDILTSEPGEGEMPNAVTTADLSTQQGCYHLYNMLLAKKGSDIRIGPESPKTDINKARKQIIMMYHPDRWQTDSDKANFFMKKVNVAWEILSKK